MRLTKWMSILIVVLSVPLLKAQPFHLQLFDTQDGLLSIDISALHQDKQGNLWIGTAVGLSKYDGYTFKNFTTTNGLPKGRVNTILETEEGHLWISTEKGIAYYKDSSFQTVSFKPSPSAEIIRKIHLSPEGDLWLGTNEKLSFLKAENKSKSLTFPDSSFFHQYPGKWFVSSFASAHNQPFLINNYNQIIEYKQGIFDTLATGKNGIYDFFYQMNYQGDGSVIIGSREGDIYNFLNQQLTPIIPSDPDRIKLMSIVERAQQFYILEENGLLILDRQTLDSQVYNIYDETNIKMMNCMIIDRESNLWIGSNEGLIRLTHRDFNLYPMMQKLMPNGIFSIGALENGTLFFTSNNAKIYAKAINQDTFIRFPLPEGFPRAEIVSNFYDSGGNLWLPTYYDGIMRVKDDKLYRYWYDDGFYPGADISFGFIDTDDQIWLGHNFGLSTLKMNGSEIDAFVNFEEVASTSFYSHLNAFGRQWFGGDDGLYFEFQDSIIQYPLGSNSFPIVELLEIQNHLWVASQGIGLLKYEMTNGDSLRLVDQYYTANGLSSDFLLDIAADDHGNVWIGTYQGVSVLWKRKEGYHLSNYDLQDGMIDKAYQRFEFHNDQQGILWAATSMGLMSFDPKDIYFNTVEPLLQLQAVSVNGNNVSLSNKEELNLSHDQNTLVFDINGISLKNPGKNRVKYWLEGAMDDWSIPSTQRSITFNSLSPGNYTFWYNAANNDNVWNSNPGRMDINIKPPFWQTWWFLLVLSIISISGVIYYIRQREQKIKTKAQEQNRFNQMIAELETKALRAQMNPHFIFNSLNAIQECILTEQIDEAYSYLFKFSKLLRKVLEGSAKNLITVEEEITILTLYLELEALRFDDKFQFKIIFDAEEVEDIYMPSLMIQPFVENAIWHGLMHKSKNRQLQIEFIADTESLICNIIDNGIGREAAERIQKKKKFKHQSMAMQLISDRLRLLEHETQKIARIKIEDLKNQASEPIGTKVIITIPNDLQPLQELKKP